MKNSDYIRKELEKIEYQNENLSFLNNDMRKDYYGMVQNLFQTFYAGYISSELSLLIKDGQVHFLENIVDKKEHINSLVKVFKNSNNPINSINSHLIISCWGCFEMSLTTLAESLLPEQKKNELYLSELEKALKLIRNENIKEDKFSEIKKALSKNHLTHVSLWRIFNSLVKHGKELGKNYSREKNDDIEFIECYSKIRNSLMHSNGIYYGNSKKYKFKDYEIIFENKKQFVYGPDKELPEFYVDLVINISNIFTALIALYKETAFISYPDIETA